jgi:hypothetical protein
MKAIADVVVAEGLASREEVDASAAHLLAHAADPSTLMGMPRVVQAWGYQA